MNSNQVEEDLFPQKKLVGIRSFLIILIESLRQFFGVGLDVHESLIGTRLNVMEMAGLDRFK